MIFQQVLRKVLEIIDYKNDKEAFVKKFLEICSQEARINSLESLEDYERELQHASNNMLREYVASIAYTLSKEQKEKLKAYIETVIASISPGES